MTHIKLRYVDSYVDAGGKRRFYVRLSRTAPRIALPGLPGSAEFRDVYERAISGTAKLDVRRHSAGSIDRLVLDYLHSPDFLRLAASTRRAYVLVIERWVRDEGIGARRIDQMTRTHIDKMLAKRAATPGSANDLLKKIRLLMNFAIERGWRRDNPATGVKKFGAGEGHHTWTDAEIEQYQQRWPVGTKERMAFAMLLYTGQRLSDVARMSWRNIEGGAIRVVQQKTRSKLEIPLHPALRDILDASDRTHVVILATSLGQPFSIPGFGNWMARKIAEAGLPDHCVTHGLRKAAARRLAEAGCTTLQIMAVTGHRSIAEVDRYTRAARQKLMAQSAMKLLGDGSGTLDP